MSNKASLSGSGPTRVLHVVGRMHYAGTETWLLNVLKRISPEQFQFDFLVHDATPGPLDDEIRQHGGRLIVHPLVRSLKYFTGLAKIMREGRYDIVHTHMANFSGIVLAAAKEAQVPARILHLHFNSALASAGHSFLRRAVHWGSKQLVQLCATHGLAVSVPAAEGYFGQQWLDDPRWRVMHCGVDLERLRRSLAAPAPDRTKKTILHVGRMNPLKNQGLLLDAFAAAQRMSPGHRLLLAGDGPLRSHLESRARQLGIADSVQFLGAVENIPELLRASDLFVFPSLSEGLGLAAVEAQAIGVPSLLSERIPDEAVIVPELIHRLRVEDSPAAWGRAIVEICRASPPIDPLTAWNRVANSSFNIDTSVRRLTTLYASVSRAAAPTPLRKAA